MWPFNRKSAKEKAYEEIAHRLGTIEEVLSDDVEDQQLTGIMHRLTKIERYISQEAAPDQPTGNNTLGDVAIGILSELIPAQFRGMAQGPIREFFSNPANVELAKNKLLELSQAINKDKQPQPAQPQQSQLQPLAPPGFNPNQSYRPNQSVG